MCFGALPKPENGCRLTAAADLGDPVAANLLAERLSREERPLSRLRSVPGRRRRFELLPPGWLRRRARPCEAAQAGQVLARYNIGASTLFQLFAACLRRSPGPIEPHGGELLGSPRGVPGRRPRPGPHGAAPLRAGHEELGARQLHGGAEPLLVALGSWRRSAPLGF